MNLVTALRGTVLSPGANITTGGDLLQQTLGTLRQLGLDPSLVLALAGFFWAANKAWSQTSNIRSSLKKYFMSTVHISQGDEIFLHVMRWLAHQSNLANSRSLIAETDRTTALNMNDIDVKEIPGAYLNFSMRKAISLRTRYTPAVGSHSFWHNGTYFRLRRRQDSVIKDKSVGFQMMDKERLVISCFGWSPEPLKNFLQHAKEEYYCSPGVKIFCPSRHNSSWWQEVDCRPARSIRTVILDGNQKIRLLDDINEYLHPSSFRWYAEHGIPVRRGYLFYGPPGTGKTSLCFALAGLFGLDIYVLSLTDPNLKEPDLLALFRRFPSRSVVLLEDIDSAGLGRAGKGEGQNEKGITLAGLLNAIDGVAAREGRVLIVTTNHPERLDPALTRPGRLDIQVPFTNITQTQAQDMFERMFEAGSEDEEPNHDTGEGISQLAAEFSSVIPDECLSPAELQGFLLRYKGNPHKAVTEVKEWITKHEERKAKDGSGRTAMALD